MSPTGEERGGGGSLPPPVEPLLSRIEEELEQSIDDDSTETASDTAVSLLGPKVGVVLLHCGRHPILWNEIALKSSRLINFTY